MEFQFGTNWSQFSRRHGRRDRAAARDGRRLLFLSGVCVSGAVSFRREAAPDWLTGERRSWFLGSWISGFFIIVTDAWMQHPVAYRLLPNGEFRGDQLLGPSDESLGVAAVRAQHVRRGGHGIFRHGGSGRVLCAQDGVDYGRIFLKVGVVAGLISMHAQIFPTGDLHGKYVASINRRNGRYGGALPFGEGCADRSAWGSRILRRRRLTIRSPSMMC